MPLRAAPAMLQADVSRLILACRRHARVQDACNTRLAGNLSPQGVGFLHNTTIQTSSAHGGLCMQGQPPQAAIWLPSLLQIAKNDLPRHTRLQLLLGAS